MNIISRVGYKHPTWQTLIILTLGFWLSASIFLDWVIMPSLYVSGMMNQSNFASAGYLMFWNFNRIELLCAALVVTGFFVLQKVQRDLDVTYNPTSWLSRGAIVLAIILMTVSLIDTYFLTPQMSAIGIQLNLFETVTEIPAGMGLMHGIYWILDGVKLFVGSLLIAICLRQSNESKMV